MTALLDLAFAEARTLPDVDQDAIASAVLAFIDPGSVPPLDDATRAAIREGMAQVERGDLATDEEIRALLADPRP